jgi:cell division protein FtsI/penicillin-binding protein 2
MTNFQRLKNYFLIFIVFFTVLGSSYIFISTVYELQFTNSDYFKNQALSYRVKTEKLKASRGNIYDKNLLVLSSSSRSYNIGIFPTKIENLDEVVNSLSAILFIEKDLLHKRIISTTNFFYLDRNIDYEKGEEIKSWNLEGVVLEPSFNRVIHTNSVSKIIGKVDPDENGIEGLELYFDSSLKGIDGEIRYEASPNGKIIPQAPIKTIQPTHGKDLILTLDSELQFISENLCSEALEKTEALNCSIVFANANTGEILIAAEKSAYLENSLNIDLLSIRAQYEPGSSLKIFSIGAGIEQGLFDENTKYLVDDKIEIIQGSCAKNYDGLKGCYRDFLKHDPYEISIKEIIERSSNVGTILATKDLDINYLEDYLHKFGFGERTGVELTGEIKGSFTEYNICKTCLSSLSIGYSVNVTQLQMVKAYSIIANGGKNINLSLIKKPTESSNIQQVISVEMSERLRNLLINVVEGVNGTGKSLKLDNYIIGGKTGTSRTHIEGDGYSDFRFNTSFTGFIETLEGPVVGSVILWGASVNPASEYVTGGSTAAPIFKTIVSNLVPGE